MTINDEIITIHTFQMSVIYTELLFHPLRNVITQVENTFIFSRGTGWSDPYLVTKTVVQQFIILQSPLISVCTTRSNIQSSVFCPHHAVMCCV